VNPPDIGDYYVWAKGWKVGDSIGAGSQGLYPFETRGVIYQAIVCHRSKRQQRLGRRKIRPGLAMMVDNIECDVGKARFNAVAILLPNDLRMSQDNEYICRDFLHRHTGLLCHCNNCTPARATNSFIKKSPTNEARPMKAIHVGDGLSWTCFCA
jgi:hypothetical protein